jgi:hypothetical protein
MGQSMTSTIVLWDEEQFEKTLANTIVQEANRVPERCLLIEYRLMQRSPGGSPVSSLDSTLTQGRKVAPLRGT